MKLHAPHLFDRIHEPLAMDFIVWLAILIGTIIAFALGPRSLF
jgi:hypothetical protein